MKLDVKQSKRLLIAGIIGCLFYVVGDFLYAATGPEQTTETIGMFTKVAYLDMATWRMWASILCGFVGTLLYYMGFHRMYELLKLRVTDEKNLIWVRLFRPAYIMGTVAWAWVHAMFMTNALIFKFVYQAYGEMQTAADIANKVLYANMPGMLIAYVVCDIGLAVIMITMVWKRIIPLKNTAMRILATFCNPILCAGVIGNLLALLPWPLNQLDHGTESFGHALVLVLGLPRLFRQCEEMRLPEPRFEEFGDGIKVTIFRSRDNEEKTKNPKEPQRNNKETTKKTQRNNEEIQTEIIDIHIPEGLSDVEKKYYLGYLATRTTLLDIYEKMIKYDYSKLLDDLYEKACNYAIIVNNTDDEKAYTKALKDLERISGAPSYILLLYLLSEQKKLKLDDENINTVTRALVKFFVRRNVTDVPNTRRLTQLFIDIIADVKEKKGEKLVKAVIKKLIDVSAPDVVFEEKLRGPLYDENPEATRFVLCSIESAHQTKEIYTELWSRDSSNKYIWTIEHIFPEGENIPKAWVDMIANGDKDLARTYRSDYVHTLGNLTITGYNQNLSNMSFEQKKDRKSKDKKKEMGYRNGLFLNKDVVKEDSWTVNLIQKRTNKIVGILLKMYDWDAD